MNREILFKGKKIGTKEWVYGSLVIAQWHNPIENENHENVYLIYSEDEHNGIPNYYGYSDLLFESKVIPETVGQYTGLIDRNGTKIFENDILEITSTVVNGGTVVRGLSGFEHNERIDCAIVLPDIVTGGFRLKVYHNGKYKRISKFSRGNLCCYKAKVIGNIYDTPELLENKK